MMTTAHTALLDQRTELRNRIAAAHRDIGIGLGKNYQEQSVHLENLDDLREIVRIAEQEPGDIEHQIAKTEKRVTQTIPL